MAIKNRTDFKVPPLVPQNIHRRKYGHRLLRHHFIAQLANERGWRRGAEIGLWQGTTISHILAHCPKVEHMVGVDLWQPQPDNCGPEGYEGWDHDQHERMCRQRLSKFDPWRYTIIKDWSHVAANSVDNLSLDFVFIDADHGYEGCADDILKWLPKINRTGFLMGHDINWSGVKQAADEFVPGYLIGPNVVWFRPAFPQADWQKEWR